MIAPANLSTEMSAFARTIYQNKYAHDLGDRKEEWPETARRVAETVVRPVMPHLTDKIRRLIAARKFMPGGRYLYAAGRRYPQINNCLAGETKIVTGAGVFALRDLVGKRVRVLNRFGEWEEATVSSFGVQRLWRVTFVNGDVVHATANHRWWTTDGSRVTTAELTRVPLAQVPVPTLDEEGIRHGIVFGDGCVPTGANHSHVLFCTPQKESLVSHFGDEDRSVTVGGGAVRHYRTVRRGAGGLSVHLQPAHYKSLPDLTCSREYARGFIAGLIATDGSTRTSTVTISCSGRDEAERVRDLAVYAGCVVCGVSRQKGDETNYGLRKRPLYVVRIKPFSAPLIRSDQIADLADRKLNRTKMWLDVESVEATDRTEEVYCCTVPGSESFTLANGAITSNCFLYFADDSREGWGDVMSKATQSLMTGGGIGIVYSRLRQDGSKVGGMGGKSSGPCALMQMVNEAGRHIRQGGSRRSAIWAGLHWDHPDVFTFIRLKDWPEVVRREKAKDFNFPATLDGTNISVILDDEFFAAYRSEHHPEHAHACKVYAAVVRGMLRSGEPGFSVDVGVNAGQHARNAPVCADTNVLTIRGYVPVGDIVGVPQTVWTGRRWVAGVVFHKTSGNVPVIKVAMTGGREIRCEPGHPFLVERWRGKGKRDRKFLGIDRVPAGQLQPGDVLNVSMPVADVTVLDNDAYTLGYIYGDGSFTADRRAELTLCTDESRRALPVIRRASRVSSVNESDGRGFARCYFSTDKAYFGGRRKDTFPEEMYAATTGEACSFLAGLFDADGNWDASQKRVRLSSNHPGFLRGVARLLEQLGILAGVTKNGHSTYGQKAVWQLVVMGDYSRRFAELIPTQRLYPELGDYVPYRPSKVKVISVTTDGSEDVFCCDVGVEEHSFMAEGVIISNCTEVVSADDSDMCNLGSLNLARFSTREEFAEAVDLGTAFLLCGTVYSKLPLEGMTRTRDKNRRLGLGLMGIHEWLLRRGYRYDRCSELAGWMDDYARSTGIAAAHADRLSISRPVATRAVAPTGTISIVAETTSGIEPIYAVAYKRRYMAGERWRHQYVIDSVAKSLITSGIDPDAIEDAVTLAGDAGRRVSFQAWLQGYVDHGISSTINLPAWGTPLNCEATEPAFAATLMEYLPRIRGVTAYPDGARGGQPLVRVPYSEAVAAEGVEYEDGSEASCPSGVCGV